MAARAGAKISVSMQYKSLRVPVRDVEPLLSRAPRAGKWRIHVAVVNAQTMRALNRKFLGHDYVTDVLAFDLSDPGDQYGEIIVCSDFALQQAKQRGISLREEFLRYCLHGFLHLLGYDDHGVVKRRKMWALQERILSKYFS